MLTAAAPHRVKRTEGMYCLQDASKVARLGFMAGTIEVDKLYAFERLLFRATRGNMFLRSAAVGKVIDPNTNKEREKAVFVVFYAGDRAKMKITKVC
jgi:V-type H+-transporting ATPase subunit a